MLDKVKIILKKVLIYASLMLLILPASLLLTIFSAPHAQAADKTPAQKITKTAPTKVEEPLKKKEAEPLKVKTSQTYKPQNFRIKAAVGENAIFLAWEPIKRATGYLVTWNISGGRSIQMKVVDKTAVTLGDLQPGTKYDVEISTIDREKNLGLANLFTYKTRGIAPTVSQTVTKQITPRIGSGVSTSQVTQNQVVQKEVTPTTEQPKTDENQEKGWSKLLVALAILIIAAGVAVGGYYGYEWWAARSEEGEPPSSKSDSRW